MNACYGRHLLKEDFDLVLMLEVLVLLAMVPQLLIRQCPLLTPKNLFVKVKAYKYLEEELQ